MVMMLLEGKQESAAVDLRFALHCWSQHYADLPPLLLLCKKCTALISVYTISVESSECILQKGFMHANKKNSNGVHFGGCTWISFSTRHDYLQVKVHFGFQKKRAHSNFRLWYMPLEMPHLHLVVSKTFWKLRDDLFIHSFSSVRCCNYLSRPFNHHEYFQGIGEGWQKRQMCVYSQPLNSCCSVNS